MLKERYLQIGTFHYQFKVKTQAIPPIVLEPQQLRFLITNQSFKDKLTPKLQKINDIFVFGCTVGLRYNDLMHLKRTNIQNTDNGSYILLNTSKTELIEVAEWTYNYRTIRFNQGKALEINNPKENSYRFCEHLTAYTTRQTRCF